MIVGGDCAWSVCAVCEPGGRGGLCCKERNGEGKRELLSVYCGCAAALVVCIDAGREGAMQLGEMPWPHEVQKRGERRGKDKVKGISCVRVGGVRWGSKRVDTRHAQIAGHHTRPSPLPPSALPPYLGRRCASLKAAAFCGVCAWDVL